MELVLAKNFSLFFREVQYKGCCKSPAYVGHTRTHCSWQKYCFHMVTKMETLLLDGLRALLGGICGVFEQHGAPWEL